MSDQAPAEVRRKRVSPFRFLQEVREEGRKVTWPSRREVYATTVAVILVSAFFGLYLWGLDLAIDWGVRHIFSFFGAR